LSPAIAATSVPPRYPLRFSFHASFSYGMKIVYHETRNYVASCKKKMYNLSMAKTADPLRRMAATKTENDIAFLKALPYLAEEPRTLKLDQIAKIVGMKPTTLRVRICRARRRRDEEQEG
jgi:hypothetical protein